MNKGSSWLLIIAAVIILIVIITPFSLIYGSVALFFTVIIFGLIRLFRTKHAEEGD